MFGLLVCLLEPDFGFFFGVQSGGGGESKGMRVSRWAGGERFSRLLRLWVVTSYNHIQLAIEQDLCLFSYTTHSQYRTNTLHVVSIMSE